MIRPLRLAALLALLLLAGPRALSAQAGGAPSIPLETFVLQVARLWLGNDVEGLLDLVTASGKVLLDTGKGSEEVNGRHAAAALRAVFADRDHVSVRPVGATLAGGRPPRGFGQISWVFRSRGTPGSQSRTVYVGGRWEGSGWRITEVRIMP